MEIPSHLVDGEALRESLNDPDIFIVDTRSDIRADRGGHIPVALPIEWTLNNSGGFYPTLLSIEELAEFYSASGVNPDKRVVTHCQTGVRGAHTWLALTLDGYPDVALYDGGWIEWANNEAFPVEP